MTPQDVPQPRSIAAKELAVSRQYAETPLDAFTDAKDMLAMEVTWAVLAGDLTKARTHAQAYELLFDRQNKMVERRGRVS